MFKQTQKSIYFTLPRTRHFTFAANEHIMMPHLHTTHSCSLFSFLSSRLSSFKRFTIDFNLFTSLSYHSLSEARVQQSSYHSTGLS